MQLNGGNKPNDIITQQDVTSVKQSNSDPFREDANLGNDTI